MSALETFMARLRAFPLWVGFVIIGVLQVGAVGAMVMGQASILREGKEVKLATVPVDPRDLLRGDYVVLSYDISTLDLKHLKGDPAFERNQSVYVVLAPGAGGYFVPRAAHRALPQVSGDEVVLQGRVSSATCNEAETSCTSLIVKYGLESYFVPEGHGRRIEDVRDKTRVAVVAAVSAKGQSRIKRLLIDDKPLYDEPMY